MKKKSSPRQTRLPGLSRYKAMIDAIPDIIMEVNDRKVYTWANRSGLEFYGDDVIGRAAGDFFIGDQETYRTVEPLFAGREDIVQLYSWQRRRDGAARLLAWWCTALKNPAGKTVGALSTARDVTEAHQSQQALRESEERFRAIFEHSRDGIILADERMKFLMVNRTMCAMLGYTEFELVGMTVDNIHPADSLPFVRETFHALLNREVDVAPNIPVKRKDGSLFVADIQSAPFSLGGARYIAGIFSDVTERNRMIEALKESESHYRAVIDATPMGIHLYRVREGEEPVFAGYNPAAEKILGVAHDRFLNAPITTAFPGLAGTGIPDRYARAALYGELWHNEHIVYRDDRITGAFDVYAFQIRHGFMAAMFSDITARKRLEQELSAQRSLTDRIMETSPVGILMIDREGLIIFANSTAEKMFELTKSETAGRVYNDPAWKITSPDGRPFTKEELPFAQVMNTGRPVFDFQHAVEWPDGRRILLTLNGSPLAGDHGEPAGVVFSFNDITDRLRAEEEHRKLEDHVRQTQKLDSVGRLAGGVAHDLNNLLTPIIGYADYYLSSPPDSAAELTPVFRGILDAAERARVLTRQLLAFSRKQPLETEVLDLNEVVGGLASLLTRTLRENIRVHYRLAPGLAAVRADHTQIDQIIINLATNAQDALPEGGEITIATANIEIDEETALPEDAPARGRFVLLSFSDNGTGMDREILHHIFEPFFTTKAKGMGTGLGLATVYGIVNQHNGFIHADSEPGRGTEFKIYFPAVREQPTPSPAAAPETERAPTPGRVLLVEDNADVRAMTERILGSLGYPVIAAENGGRALELSGSRADIVLVITDVIMPDTNGVALAQALRRRHPALKVLYMSGYADDIVTRRGILDEHTAFITKPFTVRQLKEKVDRLLGGG